MVENECREERNIQGDLHSSDNSFERKAGEKRTLHQESVAMSETNIRRGPVVEAMTYKDKQNRSRHP